jgi:transposase
MRAGVLRLSKMGGPLRSVWSWPEVDTVGLDPTMVVVCRESDGRWYVTFAVDAAVSDPLPETGRTVGVDLGIKDLAVTSDGERIANPRHLERRARNVADINAAKNILAAGQAATACGADVRHSGTSRVQSAAKQEPRPVRVGIPVVLRGGE